MIFSSSYGIFGSAFSLWPGKQEDGTTRFTDIQSSVNSRASDLIFFPKKTSKTLQDSFPSFGRLAALCEQILKHHSKPRRVEKKPPQQTTAQQQFFSKVCDHGSARGAWD